MLKARKWLKTTVILSFLCVIVLILDVGFFPGLSFPSITLEESICRQYNYASSGKMEKDIWGTPIKRMTSKEWVCVVSAGPNKIFDNNYQSCDDSLVYKDDIKYYYYKRSNLQYLRCKWEYYSANSLGEYVVKIPKDIYLFIAN
jgi:hypothetical protein